MDKDDSPKYVASFLLIIGFVVATMLLLSLNRAKTGMAPTIGSDYLEDEFGSISSPWNGNPPVSTIYEKFLNKTFDGVRLTSNQGLNIGLSDLKVTDNKGIIWLRFRLNDDVLANDAIPLMLIGDLLIYKGDMCGNTVCGGQKLCYANSAGILDCSTSATLEAGTWKELEVYFEKGVYEAECPSNSEFIFRFLIEKPTSSEPDIEINECDETYFPFTQSDTVYLFPGVAQLSDFSVSQLTNSGIFLDKIIATSDTNRIINSLITNIQGCYFDNLNTNIQIDKNSGPGTIVYPDIVSDCKYWNEPGSVGAVEIMNLPNAEVNLAMNGNDLIIQDKPADIETQVAFTAKCKHSSCTETSLSNKLMYLTIGNPKIIQLDLDTDVYLDQNSIKYVPFNLTYTGIGQLHYLVTGNSKIDVTVEGTSLKIQSHSDTATETIIFTVSDDTGNSVTKSLTITVLGPNMPPTINSWSPTMLIQAIDKGKSLDLSIQATDDKTAASSLQYKWYIDGTIQPTSIYPTYKFKTDALTEGTAYQVKGEVIDADGLSSSKVWSIAVAAIQQADSTVDNSSYTPSGCNHNNIMELGEECDGTDNTACGGLSCFDCICATQQQQTCTPQWSCTAWSACINSIRSRYCTDLNNCQSQEGKPNDQESCTESVTDTEPSTTTQPTPSTTQPSDTTTHPTNENQLSQTEDTSQDTNTDSSEQKTTSIPKRTPIKLTKKSPDEQLFSILIWTLAILIILGIAVYAIIKLKKR